MRFMNDPKQLSSTLKLGRSKKPAPNVALMEVVNVIRRIVFTDYSPLTIKTMKEVLPGEELLSSKETSLCLTWSTCQRVGVSTLSMSSYFNGSNI